MQICKSCGEKIKIIPIRNNEYVFCEAGKNIFYTELGRKVEGYKLHECRRKENADVK